MAIDIKFDLVGNPEPPTIILATRNGRKLGQLDIDEESVELIDRLNDASEVTFTVHKKESPKLKSISESNENVLKSSDDYLLTDSNDIYLLPMDADESVSQGNKFVGDLWDKITDFKLVYFKEWDCWFECKVELDEATESVKTVFCTQLGQAELSQIMLYDIEINTEKDIERDDYKIGILYDPLDSQCILRRLLNKAPHYSIAHVDKTLWNIQRSFSFDDTSIYDTFQEVAEEIGCLFVFNSGSDENGIPLRTISVYDLQQNCNDCGYRGEFTDVCPNLECPSRKDNYQSKGITYGYGKDTLIFVTSDELASEGIQLVTDTDSVKNCFKLEAGDDLMTATIRNRNPNGTDYIWYFSDATKADMPDELVEKIESYDELYQDYYNERVLQLDKNLVDNYNVLVDKYKNYYNSASTCLSCNYEAVFEGNCPNCGSENVLYGDTLQSIPTSIEGFSSLMQAYYNVIDFNLYLKSSLMPTVKMGNTSAEEQGLFLEVTLPPIIAVGNLNTVSNESTDTFVLSMARAIVHSSYKVTIDSSQLTGTDWKGNFIITNYSDEKDTYTTNTISRTITDWDETYIKQKIDKLLSKENTDDLSITGLFEKDVSVSVNSNGEYEFSGEFWEELHKYALKPLSSFHSACQACIDILIEQGVGKNNSKKNPWDTNSGNSNIDNSLYENLYVPYYNKLIAIEAEIKVRESEINTIIDLQSDIERNKVDIQNKLNFQNYLGKDLWLQFCAYRREDKYHNSNYISDGLNNAQLFKRALEFYKVAENEIFKSAELQHSISATLNNLLAIPKFKPLVESFDVGNWIRVQVDDDIYKLRLVEYEISYGDFDSISVKFSDVAKTKSGYSDLEDILSSASSMASSYDSIKRQANLGNEARDVIREWLTDGLDASLYQIKNNDKEFITIDNNGLTGCSRNDITDEPSLEQIRLTHNIIAYTDDGWESVKQAIGKHTYKYYDKGDKNFVDAIGYGVSADFVTAGVVSGSQIIGGDIYSDNYSITNSSGSYLNLRDGTFNFGGGALRFDGDKLIIGSNAANTNITELNDEWLKTTTVYAQNLNVNAANINGTLTANQIDATNLKVDAANITGNLTIGQLPSDFDLDIPTKVGDLENDIGYITESGVTTIVGGVVTTDYVNALGISVNAANINGTLTANQINLSGAITWSDLASDAQNAVNTAQSTANTANSNASDALSTANDAYDLASDASGTIDDWSYTYGGTTYIDGGMLMTGTVIASQLLGGSVGLLNSSEREVGSLEISGSSSSTYSIEMYSGGALYLTASNGDVYIEGTNVTLAGSEANTSGNHFRPDDTSYTLGRSWMAWDTLYATSCTCCTSDREKKTDFEYDLIDYEGFYDSLKPLRFKYIDGKSGRYHTGFVSQDVEESLLNNGLTSQDFAGFIKSPKENIEEEQYDYMLRYEEFVALNTWQIQKLKARVVELESKLNQLNIE